MRIGILGGTGPAGSGLGARLAVAGFDVVLGSRSKYRSLEVVDKLQERWSDRALEIDAGDKLKVQTKEDFGVVAGVDRISHTIDVRKGPSRAEMHPSAVFAFSYVPSEAMEAFYRDVL